MIPEKLKQELLKNPYYRICARKGDDCDGRITFEHAFIYAGKQIQEEWAIIPLCWYHHLGKGLNKEINHYIALSRADLRDLRKRMPKKDWSQMFSYLNKKYAQIKN